MTVTGRRAIDKRLNTADHDLLIVISTQIQGLVDTVNRLTDAVGLKANTADIVNWKSDHEARIRVLEQFNWKQAGAHALLLILIGLGLKFW